MNFFKLNFNQFDAKHYGTVDNVNTTTVYALEVNFP